MKPEGYKEPMVEKPARVSFEEHMCWLALAVMCHQRPEQGGAIVYPIGRHLIDTSAKPKFKIVAIADAGGAEPAFMALGIGTTDNECIDNINRSLAEFGIPVTIPKTQ